MSNTKGDHLVKVTVSMDVVILVEDETKQRAVRKAIEVAKYNDAEIVAEDLSNCSLSDLHVKARIIEAMQDIPPTLRDTFPWYDDGQANTDAIRGDLLGGDLQTCEVVLKKILRKKNRPKRR